MLIEKPMEFPMGVSCMLISRILSPILVDDYLSRIIVTYDLKRLSLFCINTLQSTVLHRCKDLAVSPVYFYTTIPCGAFDLSIQSVSARTSHILLCGWVLPTTCSL